MDNFTWYNPTKIIFGRKTHQQVGQITAAYAKRVLLVYGGGSVIDTAKAIGLGVEDNGDVWDFYNGSRRPQKMAKVGVVLTIPAAGSESSDGSVITNEETKEKLSCCTDFMYPDFAILNPELCYTVPVSQIRAGGAGILAHIMERYFVPNDHNDVSDRICEAAMEALITNMPKVLEDPKDYDAWAEMMWLGNIAHNGLLGKGRRDDWASHNIEHELSAIYDVAHGAGLAVVFPAWMRYVYKEHPWRFVQFASRVWHVDVSSMDEDEACLAGIHALEDFFKSVGLATHLSEIGIDDTNIALMAQKACKNHPLGSFKTLYAQDVEEILKIAQ